MAEIVSPARVAVVQAAPVLFDREATIEKAIGLIGEAASAAGEGATVALMIREYLKEV